MGVKISDLPQAPNSQNDDIFPIVQNGVTKQVSKELIIEEVNNKCIISPTEPEVDYGVWFAKGKNLFDKNNVYVLNAYITTENGVITSDNTSKTIYIKIKPNTTYTVSKIASERFKIATYSSLPVIGSTSNNVVGDNSATSLTITSGANDNYLAVWLYYSTGDTATFQQIIDTLQIEEGSTATSYEPFITPSINVEGYEIYSKPVVLYNNSSGIQDNIPLNDNYTNYTYLEIFGYTNNDGTIYKKILTNRNTFELSTLLPIIGNPIIQMYANIYSLNGTNITLTRYLRNNANNNQPNTISESNGIYITKILGYK